MKKIAKFEKVSFEQFNNNYQDIFKREFKLEEFDNIPLPKRATIGSAGYDFYIPFSISIESKSSVIIPTGIRVKIDEGYVLSLYPRSGLGFKYKLMLDNTVGIIDSDYYYSANQGHIMVKMTNNSDKTLVLNKHSAFTQGLFSAYYLTVDDDVTAIRDGGFGSSDKK